MVKAIDIVRQNDSGKPSAWKESAERYRDSWSWMRYSKQIAIAVRARMRTMNVTQSALAEKMNCSQQYVSLLLKGEENLTLETICKLESALDMALIRFTDSSVDGYDRPSRQTYLSDNVLQPPRALDVGRHPPVAAGREGDGADLRAVGDAGALELLGEEAAQEG